MVLDFTTGKHTSCIGDQCYLIFDPYTVIVELRHVSNAYYRFKKSFYFYKDARYADFVNGLPIAYPLYSNVENGYGILASYSSTVDSVLSEADTLLISH